LSGGRLSSSLTSDRPPNRIPRYVGASGILCRVFPVSGVGTKKPSNVFAGRFFEIREF
ncbi:MAG: hypothetical protein ACI81V_001471, partial [Lentimonas sp.]